MDGGPWHCTGDRHQDHPQEKEMQKKKKKLYSLKNIQVLKNITDRSNKIKGDKGRSDK